MIEVFITTHNNYDSDVAVELSLNTRASTRENKFKLENYIVFVLISENILFARIL